MEFSDRFHTIRPHFDETQWSYLSKYEKLAMVKQKQNYQVFLELVLNPENPSFVKEHQQKARRSSVRFEQNRKDKDEHLFNKSLAPNRFRPRRDNGSLSRQSRSASNSSIKTASKETNQHNNEVEETFDKTSVEASTVSRCRNPSASTNMGQEKHNFRNAVRDITQKWNTTETNGFQRNRTTNDQTDSHVWMQFVNSSSEEQYDGVLFNRTFDKIPSNEQLRLYYGVSSRKQSRSRELKENRSRPQSVFTCPHCALKFSSPIDGQSHMKHCRESSFGPEEEETMKVKEKKGSPSKNVYISSSAVCAVCKKRIILSSTTGQMSGEKCDKCMVTEKGDVQEIIPTQCGKTLYSRTVCSKKFSHLSSLKQNKMIHEEINPCTNSQSDLEQHRRTDTGMKPYSCTHCSMKFNKRCDVVRHTRTHTGEKPYSCSHCAMKFTQRGNLVTHIKSHTGEKPYSCSHCAMRFSIKHSLVTHIRTHTGEKPYSCSHCPMKFTQRGHLVTHMKTHTGEKPYLCSHCAMRFSIKLSLVTHIRTHTGENPYSCPHCAMKFRQQGTLTKHLRTHTGEKPYPMSPLRNEVSTT